jgi:hypothetical protein
MPSSRSSGRISASTSRVHSEYSVCSAVTGARRARGGWSRAGLGQADVADLALGDQLGQRADGVLDRRVRVDAVLVVQVDVVGAQPAQRALDGGADVGGAAVEPTPGGAAGVGDEPNLVASTTWSRRPLMARPTSSSLERPVDLGGVDVGDAEVERAVDGADRLGVVHRTPVSRWAP